ncbi:MAG: hypothetical protein DDT22_01369 [candidate division WS2 bacterium]|nr:hypothetical protein [Candidatus Lithacetigena glycinireducens]
MSRYYTLEEVKSIRDKINKLGERSFPLLEARLEEVMAEWRKVMTESNKITAEKVWTEWKEAMVEWDIKLFALLTSICPEAYYRDGAGYLAISKSKDEEWIIPVFTGDYTGEDIRDFDGENIVKHQAFSIWTIPKESCNEELAREVKDE